MRGRLRRWAAPSLVYLAGTIAFTWPLARGVGTRFVSVTNGPAPDVLLILWILRWGMHALATAPTAFFDANALHPTPRVLTTTEHLLGLQPLFAPLWALTQNPILALNLTTLASFALSGLFMHALVARWTRSTIAAYAGGCAFAFAPWRLDNVAGTPHLLHLELVPLVLLGLETSLSRGRRAVGTGILLALQSLCAYALAYLAWTMVAAFVAVDLAVRRRRAPAVRALVVVLLVSLAAVVPPSLPYARARATGALDYEAEALLLSGVATIPLASLVRHTMGLATPALALAALPLVLVGPGRRRTALARTLALVLAAVLALLLAGGPFGAGRPLYAVLSAVVPGFDRMRMPTRFAQLAQFCGAGLAGIAVAEGARRLRGGWRGGWHAACLAAVLSGPVAAWSASPLIGSWTVAWGDAVPPVYRWLAAHGDGGPLVELPPSPFGTVVDGALAMYFSTYHWLPVVQGHTGYYPAYYHDFLTPLLGQLPEPEALGRVARCTGLRWVVLHDVGPVRRAAWLATPGATVRGTFDRDLLLELHAATPDACAHELFAPAGATLAGAALAAPDAPHGTIAVDGVPDVVDAGGETLASVSVRNDGAAPWPCTAVRAAGRVELGVAWDGERPTTVLVPHDVAPGDTVRFGAWLTHPARPGRHRLRLLVRRSDGADAATWEKDVGVRPCAAGRC